MNNYLVQNFLGNDKVKQTLSGIISEGRLFHAVLLEGEKGCGKYELAKLYAMGVLCKDNSERPCGKCSSCKKALTSSHPDIVVYGGNGSRSFHIDTVREIKLKSYIAPNESAKKVIILRDVQDMTVQAQNALLKIFEEPPEHVVFILTCDNINRLLPTIISRAVIFRVENLPHDVCVNELKRRFSDISDEEASFYVRLFSGNLGESIRAYNDEEYKALIWSCISFIKKSGIDEYGMLLIASQFGEKQQNYLDALRILKLLFSNMLSFLIGSKTICCSDIEPHAERIGALQTAKIIDIIDDTRDKLLQNVNQALSMSCMCAKIQDLLLG